MDKSGLFKTLLLFGNSKSVKSKTNFKLKEMGFKDIEIRTARAILNKTIYTLNEVLSEDTINWFNQHSKDSVDKSKLLGTLTQSDNEHSLVETLNENKIIDSCVSNKSNQIDEKKTENFEIYEVELNENEELKNCVKKIKHLLTENINDHINEIDLELLSASIKFLNKGGVSEKDICEFSEFEFA
jgi:MarR-like DNA-binding transcriptional regulator SgrR of sgrS sRNA